MTTTAPRHYSFALSYLAIPMVADMDLRRCSWASLSSGVNGGVLLLDGACSSVLVIEDRRIAPSASFSDNEPRRGCGVVAVGSGGCGGCCGGVDPDARRAGCTIITLGFSAITDHTPLAYQELSGHCCMPGG